MTKGEFTEGLTLIGEIFNKQYSEIELSVYYDLVKDYSNEIWKSAITKIIQSEKYAPKPVDLLRALEDMKMSVEIPIIEIMIKNGYFKRPSTNLKRYQLELEMVKDRKEREDLEDKIEQEKSFMVMEELRAIDKAKSWVINGCVPDWLLSDMRKYYTKQLTTQKLLN